MTRLDMTSAAADPTLELAGAAFEAVQAEIDALPDEQARAVNVEPMAAVTTALGVIAELRAFRPQFEKTFVSFDFVQFDKLGLYALAFGHVHGVYRGMQVPKGKIAELANELSVIRDRLYGDAMSLANNGYFSAARLAQCKTATGYRALTADILTLVPLFKEHWSKIENRTPVTLEALAVATRRAVTLMEVLGLKEQGPELVSEVARQRAKAFTLFLRAYDEARHAVAYVRRDEGDANEVVPSLYLNRGRRRDADAGDDAPDSSASARGDVAVTTTAEKAPEANTTPKTPDAPPQIQINNPKNLPIDNPFTSN